MFDTFDMLVYAADDLAFDTEGLVGPLLPQDPRVEEVAGDDWTLEFGHPYDADGRWKALQPRNLVKCWVPMRTPPDIDSTGAYVATIETWKTDATASRTDRSLLSTRADTDKTKTIKVLPGNLTVAILNAYPEGRWKIRCKYGTGWISPDGLDSTTRVVHDVDEDADNVGELIGEAAYRPQLFEIVTVERSLEGVQVTARHESYQWMKNTTRVFQSGSVTLVDIAARIANNCRYEHDFTIHTDVLDQRTGVLWEYRNPIDCIMNPEDGALVRWGCELLRDGHDIYLLHRVGRDRGAVIEVGRNMSGMTLTEDVGQLATCVMPVGVGANGYALVLPEMWLESEHVEDYGHLIYTFKADDATVDDDTPQATVYARMRAQAQALLDEGIDVPAVTVDIEVAQVEDPEALLQELEPVLLYDTVHVYDADRGVQLSARVIRRVVDPTTGRLLEIELGTPAVRLSDWMTGRRRRWRG